MSKFKNCFVSELPNYVYEIVIDGETFGKAHLMNSADRGYIEAKSAKKTLVNGELNIDWDSQELITSTLERCLIEWVLPKPLCRANIIDLTDELRAQVFSYCSGKDRESMAVAEDAEKN